MASYLTGDTLIESIKRRASIPTHQALFEDSDFLAFADEELAMGLVPSILRMREDYLLYTLDIPLVQGQTRYDIPYRAIGNKLRDVAFKDTNGNIFEMTRISIDDLPWYNGTAQSSGVYTFFIENNEIVLAPETLSVPATGSLKVTFYIRPNSIVKMERVGVITSINRTTGDVVVTSIPEDFSVTKLYDFIQIHSPHKTLSFDVAPTGIDTVTNTITFDPTTIPTKLAVNDHLCLATESGIPQVPSDLHVVLAHRAASRCLEAVGDLESLQAANVKLGEFEKQIETVIHDRVESSPKKIVARHGALRSGLYSRRFRRF